MKIVSSVLEAAKPFLKDVKIKDVVVGISLVGIELDNGNVGVSYVLRNHLPGGCSIFTYVQEAIGRPAIDIASWLENGNDDLQRCMGGAVLSAAAPANDLPDDERGGNPFGTEIRKEDKVGMVGYLAPIASPFEKKAGKLIVFDEGLSQSGNYPFLAPMNKQKTLLPTCDIVLISGTSVLNGSIDFLLSLCSSAREVILIGASAPMYPRGFKDTPVTRLAGSCWDSTKKQEIFQLISKAGGIAHIKKYMNKKRVILK